MTRLIILFFIILSSAMSSCEKEDLTNSCSIDNPIEELEWLKELIISTEKSTLTQYSYIQQTEYLGETVFINNNCCPFCNTVIPVYNCKGKVICFVGKCNEFEDAMRIAKIIWQPETFSCTIE